MPFGTDEGESLFARLARRTSRNSRETRPTPTLTPQPETTPPNPEPKEAKPDYAPLKLAMAAAEKGDFNRAYSLTAKAQDSLRAAPLTESVWLAYAAYINALDENFGNAGRFIHRAVSLMHQVGPQLEPKYQRAIMSLLEKTLARTPIRKLPGGSEYEAAFSTVHNLYTEGRYGEALFYSRNAKQLLSTHMCLRSHPHQPTVQLENLLSCILKSIERLNTTDGINHLHYGTTGRLLISESRETPAH